MTKMMMNDPIRASGAALDDLTLTTTAPVEIEATADNGKRPTFDILGYTGASMRIAGFHTPVVVDLAGLQVSGQEIPALRDHDSARIVGQTEAIEISSEGVRLKGTITGENADANEVVSQSRNGFKWRASIGAAIVRREFLESGKSAEINGREVVGPLLIARESRLNEISFVAIGADGMTSANVAASNPSGTLERDHLMNFEQWLQAKGFDPAALSDGQKAVLKAAYDADPAIHGSGSGTADAGNSNVQAAGHGSGGSPGQGRADAHNPAARRLEDIFADARREDERVARITEITASAIRDRPTMLDDLERESRLAIEAKTDPTEYELRVLRATRASAPGIYVRSGDRKASGRMIEAAVCLGLGLDSPETHFEERTLEAANDRFPGGLGLVELLTIAARENGHSGHLTAGNTRELLRAAFGPSEIRASGFSTISLPGILSNIANKFLVQSFNAVEDSWRSIAARRPVRDFKAVTSYSLTGGLEYEKLGPTGEIKHGTVGEAEYTNRAETYARMLAITRRDIINDDIGALTQVPQRLDRGAALKLNDVFWRAFLDNAAFFTAARGNLFEGVTVGTDDTRLGIEGLTRGFTGFLDQTDHDGHPVAVTPRILLVPNSLFVLANNIMNSTELRNTAADNTFMTANPFAGRFRVVSSSYLSNASYTGNSNVAWYLLADPNELPVIEVAFLNGRERPVIESADADFDTLGIMVRGYHDFGTSLHEFRGGVKMSGEAA